MNTAAIGTTFTILGSLAYAAGQGAALRPQPIGAVSCSSVHEDSAVSQRHQGTTMAALAGGDGSCTIGEPLNWFTQVHVLPECVGAYLQHLYLGPGTSAFDVDGDGTRDQIVLLREVPDGAGAGGMVYQNTLLVSAKANGYCCIGQHLLFKTDFAVTGNSVSMVVVPLLDSALVINAVCELADAPNCDDLFLDGNVQIAFADLRDMDSDGDLDALLRVEWSMAWGFGLRMIWIENTVKAGSPLAADINRDGVVDGKDLASVLAAWTP
jgi:hypothetical protein